MLMQLNPVEYKCLLTPESRKLSHILQSFLKLVLACVKLLQLTHQGNPDE